MFCYIKLQTQHTFHTSCNPCDDAMINYLRYMVRYIMLYREIDNKPLYSNLIYHVFPYLKWQ